MESATKLHAMSIMEINNEIDDATNYEPIRNNDKMMKII